MVKKTNFLKVLTITAILAMMFSNVQHSAVQAQGGDGLKRQVNAESGRVSFLSPANGRSLSASRALGQSIGPQEPAMALADRYGPEFGLDNAERDLTRMESSRSKDGRVNVRFQQNQDGVPIMGGELIVSTDDSGNLYSISGEVSPDLSLSTQPAISPQQAQETALQAVAKWYGKTPDDFTASKPELWIYDESLLQPSTHPVELSWRMEITARDGSLPVRELVLVNAQKDSISLHFNQIDAEWHADRSSGNIPTGGHESRPPAEVSVPLVPSPLVNTYTANSASVLPGTFLCNQNKQPCTTNNADPAADAAHKYALGTYSLYMTQFNRDSIDNAGMIITSSVHYCDQDLVFGSTLCPFYNAFWNGEQMVYGDGYGFSMADDVVAHELTHGVTQYESNLFYYYQSGAINESFSDLWGEYYDQSNGQGNDTAAVKWIIGEDVSGYPVPAGFSVPAIRSMSNPPALQDPDKISSPYYYEGEDDNGGVHYNSGINNKAVYLMVDGGTFNGKTIPPLGWDKVIAIYYEVNTNLLTSGADYSDLYYALQQACTNLIGQKGISADDCMAVKAAIDAVEMNGQPAPNFNIDAPLCTVGAPVLAFADDLETGLGKWTLANGAVPRWQYDSPYGPYAQSGQHSLYGDDSSQTTGTPTDDKARLVPFVVPQNAYLHFAQAYDFETGYDINDPSLNNYDGGVLEYSTNGGSTWVDAGPLMDYNGYKGNIYNQAVGGVYINPLHGRSAFVGTSHGYISTRLNLSSLAGKTVSFRWRMGLDGYVSAWGWWVDSIKVYTCGTRLTFADVPTTHPYYNDIEILYANGLTGGCSTAPLKYCPDEILDRAEASVFMMRGNYGSGFLPNPASNLFQDDWSKGTWARPWAESMREKGLTSGCSLAPFLYCPWVQLPREQAAIFGLKMKYGNGYLPPPGTGTVFADLTDPNYYATSWAEKAYADGLITDCGTSGGKPKFCPATLVTRGLGAYIIVRARNLTMP